MHPSWSTVLTLCWAPAACGDNESSIRRIGDPCTRPADPMCEDPTGEADVLQGTCGEGQECLLPAACPGGWPDGACSIACDPAVTDSCPSGTICVNVGVDSLVP